MGEGFKFLARCVYAGSPVGSSSTRLFLRIYRLIPCWRSRVGTEKSTARGHLKKPMCATASCFFFEDIWRTGISPAFRLEGQAAAVEIAEKATCCKLVLRKDSCGAELGGWYVWGGTWVPLQLWQPFPTGPTHRSPSIGDIPEITSGFHQMGLSEPGWQLGHVCP